MNKVILTGNLTKDPELKYIPGSGTAAVTCSIAVKRIYSKEDAVDFITIVVFGKNAENLANYQSKGSKIGVVGRIQTRSYDAKEGGKRYVTEVVADEIEFLIPKSQVGTQSRYDPDYDVEFTPVDDGDIPF